MIIQIRFKSTFGFLAFKKKKKKPECALVRLTWFDLIIFFFPCNQNNNTIEKIPKFKCDYSNSELIYNN